jgi:predicted HTH transcriptional regulator
MSASPLPFQLPHLWQGLRLGKDSTLELKQLIVKPDGKGFEPHPDGLSDELAALANASGGWLMQGIGAHGLSAQYHLGAVFEALVNAVAHRDYSLHGQRIRLFLFADRLEIHSPGALPNTLSIESMRRLSVPRNEILTSLLSRYYPVQEPELGKTYLMDKRGFG